MFSQTVDSTLVDGLGGSPPIDCPSLQQKDPDVGCIIEILDQNQSLNQLSPDNPEITWMFQEISQLVLHDKAKLQLVLPDSLRHHVLQGFHSEVGHLG